MNVKHAWILWAILTLAFNLTLFILSRSGHIFNASATYVLYICELLLLLLLTFTVFRSSDYTLKSDLSDQKFYFWVLTAFALRIILSRTGHNYDLESFEIVADHVLNGDNLYAATNRYNYGPVWAYMCAAMKFLSSIGGGYNRLVFHSYMSCTLFLFELLLLKQLDRHGFTRVDKLLWLLNPIAIILIGHHSQFDIIALALGFMAINKLEDNQDLTAALLLGLSLVFKHILAFLPIALLFNSRLKTRQKIILLVIPYLIFAIGFLPFIDAWESIRNNVIGYQLNHGKTLIYNVGEFIFPNSITDFKLPYNLPFTNAYKPLWIGILLLTGYVLRKSSPFKNLMAYTCVLVAFSPAISEQYFIIPLAFVIYLRNEAISWVYMLAAFFYLQFVSEHNTSKYFNLEDLGLKLDTIDYKIDFCTIQFILMVLTIVSLRRFREQNRELP